MLEIDGSFGEGGGQILRTSLALSLITQTPFRLVNIRKKRTRPGLRRQHLTAVRAAAQAGNADVKGDEVNSTELLFHPRPTCAGEYHFAIGTAGSTTLVFQTVLPALLLCDRPSYVILEGGTHNHKAPAFEFIERAFLPLIVRMGPSIELSLERRGFYPAGGARWSARIQPAPLRPLHILERGSVRSRCAKSIVANLPMQIAEREIATVRSRTGWQEDCLRAESVEAIGPGNAISIEIASENITEIFSEVGARGVPAETVAKRAVDCASAYLAAAVPVGEHLADQLLIPLALAGEGSFITMRPTLHTVTNAEVVAKFLPVRIDIQRLSEEAWQISVERRIAT